MSDSTADQQQLRVAVIGLGAMGLPMATHLATAFTVTGFDPFEPRRELVRVTLSSSTGAIKSSSMRWAMSGLPQGLRSAVLRKRRVDVSVLSGIDGCRPHGPGCGPEAGLRRSRTRRISPSEEDMSAERFFVCSSCPAGRRPFTGFLVFFSGPPRERSALERSQAGTGPRVHWGASRKSDPRFRKRAPLQVVARDRPASQALPPGVRRRTRLGEVINDTAEAHFG